MGPFVLLSITLTRAGLTLMILCGAATALKYYSIGADQVKLGTPAERYVPQHPWYDVNE